MLFTQGRALVVGVGKYQYVPAANVAQTTNDAVSLAQALTNQGGYPQNQVTLLADGSASRAALIASLQQLANTAQPGDIVIFFYSGHGDYATDGSFYLTTSDTQLDGDKIKLDTGLGQSEFLTLLRAIKARQLLIIINSCFSGKLEPSLGFNTEAAPAALGSGVPDAVTTAALATGSGRVIITACQESERSWVGNGNLTIFGQSLVQGINGSAGLPGPFVSANDLYNYLFKTVPPAAQQLGHQQEPVLTVLRQVGLPLLVALNAATARSGGQPGGIPLSIEAQPTTKPKGNVHQVDPEESQHQLQQIMGNQYNAGHDQFINNDNVSTGGGNINDYGGVGGSVNSGSGSQTNVTAGNISGNQGNVAVGSGINQSNSSGDAALSLPANPVLASLRDLREKVSTTSGVNPADLAYIVSRLNAAIRQLRDNPKPDLGQVNTMLTNAANGLGDAGLSDLQHQLQQLISALAANGLALIKMWLKISSGGWGMFSPWQPAKPPAGVGGEILTQQPTKPPAGVGGESRKLDHASRLHVRASPIENGYDEQLARSRFPPQTPAGGLGIGPRYARPNKLGMIHAYYQSGRGERTRTSDPLVPNQVRYHCATPRLVPHYSRFRYSRQVSQAAQGGDCRAAMEHPDAERQAEDGQAEGGGQHHPQQRGPPAHQHEVDGAGQQRQLGDAHCAGNQPPAGGVFSDIVAAHRLQGQHLGNEVEHGQADRQADDGQVEQPGEHHPQVGEPPAEEHEVDSAHNEGRASAGKQQRRVRRGVIIIVDLNCAASSNPSPKGGGWVGERSGRSINPSPKGGGWVGEYIWRNR